MRGKFWLSTTLILIVLIQVACTFSVATLPAETPTVTAPEATAVTNFEASPTPTVPEATAVTNPEASPTLTEACPEETTETKLYQNNVDGYCLLYPQNFTLVPPRFIVLNPVMRGDKAGDAWVDIRVEAAKGRTTEQVANDAIAAVGDGFNIQLDQFVVDDTQAIVVDGLPGPDSLRNVYVVSTDRLYTFTFMPWGQNSELETLYDWVMKSLHFLP